MNWGLLFGFFVLLLGSAQANNSSNPECEDLDALQKQATTTANKMPLLGAHVTCNTNNNCTGLICEGTLKGKYFHGTVILEACNEPVSMLVHVNNKRLEVKNGDEKKVMEKPLAISIKVNLKKKNNAVYVTLKIKVCSAVGLLSKLCPYLPIITDKKIRTRCNGSEPTMFTSLPPQPRPHHTKPKGKGTKNSKSPECKGLNDTNKQLVRHFGMLDKLKIFPGSKINCIPANDCSELRCTGVANDDPFNATVTIDYCSGPVRLGLKVDSKKKTHIDHEFKDGETYPIIKPFLNIKVELKRIKNIILLSASIPTLGVYLVRDMSITVDPSHCSGYKGWTTIAPHAEKSGSKLSPGAIGGVVIAVIVFFVLLIAIIVWIVRGKRQKTARYNDLVMNDDSDPLVFDSNPVA